MRAKATNLQTKGDTGEGGTGFETRAGLVHQEDDLGVRIQRCANRADVAKIDLRKLVSTKSNVRRQVRARRAINFPRRRFTRRSMGR